MNKKIIALGVVALILIPNPAFAKSHHIGITYHSSTTRSHKVSQGYSYYNTDTRYGKRQRMLSALGIHHTSGFKNSRKK